MRHRRPRSTYRSHNRGHYTSPFFLRRFLWIIIALAIMLGYYNSVSSFLVIGVVVILVIAISRFFGTRTPKNSYNQPLYQNSYEAQQMASSQNTGYRQNLYKNPYEVEAEPEYLSNKPAKPVTQSYESGYKKPAKTQYCQACGGKIADGDVFCSYCGTKVSNI